MRLKLVRRIGYHDEPVGSVGDLSMGKEYYCLGVVVDLPKTEITRCKYHVLQDFNDGEPLAFYANALCFEIVSTSIPATWRTIIRESGKMFFGDPILETTYLLERYYNDEEDAIAAFAKICRDAMI